MGLRKIKYILFAAAALVSYSASSQNVSTFKDRLSRPSDSSAATVNITEHGSAADAVRKYDSSSKPTTVPGYRIRIFFGNGQNARGIAQGTQGKFKNEFPGIPTYLVYENPAWMVTVGNCVTMDEALMLWNKVKKSFDTAFIWRGELPVSEIQIYDTQVQDGTGGANKNNINDIASKI